MSDDDLKALGDSAERNKDMYQFEKPDKSLLERFPSPGSGVEVVIEAPEVTSLCPKTGQPDFATIHIWYMPDQWAVESKALKLFLMGFREYGIFHEAMVVEIRDALVELLDPLHITVFGDFTARGGIAFKPTATYVKDEISG